MIDEAWFETVGRQHYKQFFGEIERAYATGSKLGLKPKRVNADDILRIYRGEHLSVSINRINALKEKGYRISEISEFTGVPAKFICHYFWRLKNEANRRRSKSG